MTDLLAVRHAAEGALDRLAYCLQDNATRAGNIAAIRKYIAALSAPAGCVVDGWMVSREGDPTFPRYFVLQSMADTMASTVTNPPLATVAPFSRLAAAPAVSGAGEWVPVADRAPTAADADEIGDVAWLRGKTECLGRVASGVPVDATHWKPTGRALTPPAAVSDPVAGVVACYRLRTGNRNKWQWMDGLPCEGTLRLAAESGWTIEYAALTGQATPEGS